MPLIHDELTPELKRLLEIEKFGKLCVHIGIQSSVDGEIFTIARVHEYGATIHAKKAKNLAIPISKKSKGKSPRDFPGLFFIEVDSGLVYGVVEKRKKKNGGTDNLEFLFILLKSVNIPERSFIRACYDKNKEKIAEIMERHFEEVRNGKATAEKAWDSIGAECVELTRRFFNDATNFKPKGNIARAVNPSYADNPLVGDDALFERITHEVTNIDE